MNLLIIIKYKLSNDIKSYNYIQEHYYNTNPTNEINNISNTGEDIIVNDFNIY